MRESSGDGWWGRWHNIANGFLVAEWRTRKPGLWAGVRGRRLEGRGRQSDWGPRMAGSSWAWIQGHWEPREASEQGRSWGRKPLRKQRRICAHMGPGRPLSHKSWKSRVVERKPCWSAQDLPVFGPEDGEAGTPGPKFPSHLHLQGLGVPEPWGQGRAWGRPRCRDGETEAWGWPGTSQKDKAVGFLLWASGLHPFWRGRGGLGSRG